MAIPQDDDELLRRVKEALVRALLLDAATADTIQDETPLLGDEGPGLDSVDLIELAVELEREFGVRLPEGEEARDIYVNMKSIAGYLRTL